MEGSRTKDFGKELGMIHEGIITLRNLGLSAEGWQKMTCDKNLARKVIELVEGQKELWLEEILAREQACHLAFFGQEFDLTDFADTLKKYGELKIKFWQKFEMEPAFLPEVAMPQDANFRGWKIKPKSWLWQKVAEGKVFRDIHDVDGKVAVVKEVKLDGITVLIDTRLKPKYDAGKQMYKNDNLLGPIIEDLRRAGKITKYKYGSQSSRFSVSADEWEEHIKPALAEKLGLEISQLRLERAIEVDVIPQLYPYMPRKDDGNSNTWVWYGEYFEDRGHLFSSDDFFYNSLGLLYYDLLGFRQSYKSVRPLAVL